MSGVQSPDRAALRTTALGTLAIFLPLSGTLLWWGYSNRYAAGDPEVLNDGRLSVVSLLIASCLAAGGPSLLLALVLANQRRLRTVFRPRVGKVITAVFLAVLTPTAVNGWVPFVLGPFVLPYAVTDLHGRVIALFAAGTLAWFIPTAILISGIRHKVLRIAGFALVWWSIYGALLLAAGYETWGFH